MCKTWTYLVPIISIVLVILISNFNKVEADNTKLAVRGPDGKMMIVGVCRGMKNGNCAPGELEKLKANWEAIKKRNAKIAADAKRDLK